MTTKYIPWPERHGRDTAGELPAVADLLPDEPEHADDPRWVYDLTKPQAYAGWPCGQCGTRRDEHADQAVQSAFPALDITDHTFIETNLVPR